MLRARNIIYGFCKSTNPPKQKYLISLYRSDNIEVVAVFPTSKRRSGSFNPKHGSNRRDDVIVSYVFEAKRVIGQKYNSTDDFSFPLQTTIPFDYCFREDSQEDILDDFINPLVVGVLSEEEYINLLYAFIQSPLTPEHLCQLFDKILHEYLDKD